MSFNRWWEENGQEVCKEMLQLLSPLHNTSALPIEEACRHIALQAWLAKENTSSCRKCGTTDLVFPEGVCYNCFEKAAFNL